MNTMRLLSSVAALFFCLSGDIGLSSAFQVTRSVCAGPSRQRRVLRFKNTGSNRRDDGLRPSSPHILLHAESDKKGTVPSTAATTRQPDDEQVQLGSKEYYDGFLSVNDEPVERVTGDAVLGPTFKFVGGFAAIIAILLLGFLASNGLI